jgi:hypothetical protein
LLARISRWTPRAAAATIAAATITGGRTVINSVIGATLNDFASLVAVETAGFADHHHHQGCEV